MDQREDKKTRDWRIRDLTGQRFGRLVARSWFRQDGSIYWNCDCDCGKTDVPVKPNNLTMRKTRSCGCLQKELARERMAVLNADRVSDPEEPRKLTYNETERFCCECANCVDIPSGDKFCLKMQANKTLFSVAIKNGLRMCPFFELDVRYYRYDEDQGGMYE